MSELCYEPLTPLLAITSGKVLPVSGTKEKKDDRKAMLTFFCSTLP